MPATAAAAFSSARRFPPLKQGFFPDVISTDLHTGSMNAGMKDILNTMSKFLNIGMPLQDVIKANTAKAAEVIKRPDLGHLGVGAEADVAVLNVRKGQRSGSSIPAAASSWAIRSSNAS